MQQADGILFGSPTILGKQLQPIDEIVDVVSVYDEGQTGLGLRLLRMEGRLCPI